MTPRGSPFRALLLLLLLDMAIGLWLKLHKPEALPLFVVVNAPTVGVLGFFWPLLPKDTTDRLGVRLAEALSSTASSRVLLLLGGCLFVASLLLASIRVELLDSDTATTIHIVRGSQGALSGEAPVADSFRLNRLNSPTSKVLPIPPWGQSVWLYSPTHVLFRDGRLMPWLPLHLQYPGDFAPMAVVAALPRSRLMSRLLHGELRLSLRERDGGPVLASRVLDTAGTMIAFLRPSRITAEDSAKWHAKLNTMLNPANDSAQAENVALVLRRWLATTWVPTARPLRQGDTLFWEVRSTKDTSTVKTGRVVLDAPLVDLDLKF